MVRTVSVLACELCGRQLGHPEDRAAFDQYGLLVGVCHACCKRLGVPEAWARTLACRQERALAVRHDKALPIPG